MLRRIAVFLGLSLVFVAGTLALAQRITIAQVPAATETPAQAAPVVAPVPAAPQPVDAPPAAPSVPAPVVIAPPAAPAPAAPVIAAPPAEPVSPAPVVAAPPATPEPVVSAPPVSEPAPAIASPAPLPPEKPAIPDKTKKVVAAKQLFAAKPLPSIGKAMAIGYYPRGCLQGGVELPPNGPNWQVMRLSRNRNWGHPNLVNYLEQLAPAAAKATGWHGILIGDLAQPRGGPTPSDHVSHQTGLDVDIWFVPMPARTLTAEEREKMSANNLVSADWKSVNPKTWTPQHVAFIRTAAENPQVERVLVNAAIKKEICRVEKGNTAAWMSKVRPWYGHHDHIHVRLKCPTDSPNCRAQPAGAGDDGCSAATLDHWFSDKVLKPKKQVADKPAKPAKPPKPITLADLPPACTNVLNAPAREVKTSRN